MFEGKPILFSRRIILYLSALYSLVLFGCVSQPLDMPSTTPSLTSSPVCLIELSKVNLYLAEEIQRLPEFRDDISEQEERAICMFVEYYYQNQPLMDQNLVIMDEIGRNHRTYNSLLEAALWVISSSPDDFDRLMNNFTIDSLLRNAWDRYFQSDIDFDEYVADEARKLYESCIDPTICSRIFLSTVDNRIINKSEVIEMAINNPDAFSYQFDIENYQNMLHSNDDSNRTSRLIWEYRWSDFDMVVERLSDPVLIHYFASRFFNYEFYADERKYPERTFNERKGNCMDIARFDEYCLLSHGYHAYLAIVDINSDRSFRHAIVIFEYNDSLAFMDNGRNNSYKIGFGYNGLNDIPYRNLSPYTY